MLDIQYHSGFKKDLKKVKKRGLNIQKLNDVILLLQNEEQLPEVYLDHPLRGNKKGYRECHIAPDWLLVYQIKKELLVLVQVETGTHSDLFE